MRRVNKTRTNLGSAMLQGFWDAGCLEPLSEGYPLIIGGNAFRLLFTHFVILFFHYFRLLAS